MSKSLALSSTPIASASSVISHHPPSPDNLYASGSVQMMIKSSLSVSLSLSATLYRSKCSCPFASTTRVSKKTTVRCDVAVKSAASVDADPSSLSSPSSETELGAEEKAKVGAKVRVKLPLKVYHVVRVPEVELTGMEGVIKDYVAVWKGKRISANLPYKVEFVKEIEGRGPVKFFVHLKDDEFEYID